MKARFGSTSTRRLAATMLARCHVCGVEGPAQRMAEHLREDHACAATELLEQLRAVAGAPA